VLPFLEGSMKRSVVLIYSTVLFEMIYLAMIVCHVQTGMCSLLDLVHICTGIIHRLRFLVSLTAISF
jgi:hypothetical protein